LKLITSIVRADRVEDVTQALGQLNVLGLVAVPVQDYTPQPHQADVWRGRAYVRRYAMKMEIRFAVADETVDDAIGVILRTARTGCVGDGFVSVQPMDDRYNIGTRTREVP
jgi:nitrogen regulatory protein PII